MYQFSMIVLVILQPPFFLTGSEVRLVNQRRYTKNGHHIVEGLLEVFAYGEWGNVCDDEFSNVSATVVCKMLGFLGRNASAIPAMGGGMRPITMDQVMCIGSEESILKCPYGGWGKHNCQHKEDVGVRCVTLPIFSISGGTSGFLQVNFGNGNYYVCNNYFLPANLPSSVCQSLGLTIGSFEILKAPKESHIYDIKFMCEDDLRIETCSYTISDTSCESGIILLKCSRFQLVDSDNIISGRVSIMHQNHWGSICDDGFSNTQASVICRELGYSWNGRFSAEYKHSAKHTYFLDNVVCSGSEHSVTACDHSAWKVHNCDVEYREDVGVDCLTDNMDLRLDSGFTTFEGIPQIFLGNDYVNICSDFFNTEDAIVFCRELMQNMTSGIKLHISTSFSTDVNDNGRNSSIFTSAVIVDGRSYQTQIKTIYKEFFNCKGNESRLIDCPRYFYNCPRDHYVAVVCDPTMPSVEMEVPSPLMVNLTTNITCMSLGGIPAPKIWWDCCNSSNTSVMVTHLGNATVSTIEVIPHHAYNGMNCTCYLHQEETTHPIIAESRTLLVHYPVLERFTLEVPTFIENTYFNITCSSSSGNPLPQLGWFCDSIEPDNVTVEITSSTSRAVLSFIPKRGDNGNNCTCFGQQERTTFHNLSESVRVNILYAVLHVAMSSTVLKPGQLGYVICRASPGNPQPKFQWKCDNSTKPSVEVEIDDSLMSVMYFTVPKRLNGLNCSCFVRQEGTHFEIKRKYIVLKL